MFVRWKTMMIMMTAVLSLMSINKYYCEPMQCLNDHFMPVKNDDQESNR